jgi:hypothetical protein
MRPAPFAPRSYSPECVELEFSEVGLPEFRVLGSCASPCNPSYFSSMRNMAGLQVTEETRLSRFHILVASLGCREGGSVG